MDSPLFKKEKKIELGTKRYGLEVGVKTGCNVIISCHVSLWSKNDLNTTHKTFSNGDKHYH